jgi:hypothetical protein
MFLNGQYTNTPIRQTLTFGVVGVPGADPAQGARDQDDVINSGRHV